MKSKIRPKCEYCDKDYADNCTDYWRSYHEKWECKSCQVLRLNYPTKNYQKNKLDFCQNEDGRLGFECNINLDELRKSFITDAFLEKDHIDENHGNDDLSNFQTLCVICHKYKTNMCCNLKYIYEDKNPEEIIRHMLKCIYQDKEVEDRVYEQLCKNSCYEQKQKNKIFKPNRSNAVGLEV